MLKARFGFCCIKYCTRVDLPLPEGALNMISFFDIGEKKIKGPEGLDKLVNLDNLETLSFTAH